MEAGDAPTEHTPISAQPPRIVTGSERTQRPHPLHRFHLSALLLGAMALGSAAMVSAYPTFGLLSASAPPGSMRAVATVPACKEAGGGHARASGRRRGDDRGCKDQPPCHASRHVGRALVLDVPGGAAGTVRRAVYRTPTRSVTAATYDRRTKADPGLLLTPPTRSRLSQDRCKEGSGRS